jgi:hypothetical protein
MISGSMLYERSRKTTPLHFSIPKHTYIGTDQCGLMIVTRAGVHFTQTDIFPPRRSIAEGRNYTYGKCLCAFGEIASGRPRWILNIGLTYLLRQLPQNCLLGRNFNCVLSAAGCTGEHTSSKSLDILVHNLGLTGSWKIGKNTPRYSL